MKQKKKKDAAEQAQSGADDGHQCNGGGGGGGSGPRPIKSALKRTGTGRKSSGSKSKRHVQFNENMNTFFESDYVIVIRDDDCDFDEEDFDFWSQHPCSCGDDACFQPWLDDEEARGRPRFDPYEEQPATLSPPDGYKDGCPRHMPSSYDRHDDELTAAYNSDVTDRCCDEHPDMSPYYSVGCPASYMGETNKPHTESTPPPRPNEQPQLKATSSASGAVQPKPNTVCDTNTSTAQPRCIVETITMTTVTERQIVQATKRPGQDGASEDATAAKPTTAAATVVEDASKTAGPGASSVPADEGYVIIRLGNNTMVYNNRNPNSAVRQLFPSTKFVCPPTRIKETDDARLLNKYLITEDSLRAFDSRTLNGYKEPQSDDDDDTGTSSNLIRRTIERSTLRRNTSVKKNNFGDAKEISLIEKIRRLTCDSDEDQEDPAKKADKRPDPPYAVLLHCESSATATSGPAYKKPPDSVGNSGGNRYDHGTPDQQQPSNKPNLLDLCDGHSTVTSTGKKPPPPPVRSNSSGKPFLTTLATACVSGNVHPSPPIMQESPPPQQPQQCPPQPDVVAGTQQQPSASGQRQEELAAFVQQDSGRLDKIRKRYLPTGGSNASNAAEDEDDENDDYGFNRRPEVHGIRSGFSAQILIKNQPPQQRPANRPYYPTVDGQPDFVPQRYPPPQPTAVVKARIQSERPPPPSYPAATAAAQRSIIRVTHGQQQTIRVPYQAVGPVQVHLLTTAAAAAAAAGHPVVRHPNEYIVHQHGHARIHHGQQFVIARGTQTAAISTTRFYQLPPPPPSTMQPTSAIESQHQQQLFKQTSPTRSRQVPQEFSDHDNISSVAQTPPPPPPKNPVMFYGMNV
ncbi:uncharacterized protein LOC126835272 isoform X2 [Adelges cooleyi]|uniref:uncharacterized protein LOC126835272 isoform X2 n=1 Tax=Adelges cooleyi TaxID=133065 RepID=UPI00217FBEAB|nr:uncharacterized protein LOC126835272 isoform X2 [Adelges cooleyi]